MPPLANLSLCHIVNFVFIPTQQIHNLQYNNYLLFNGSVIVRCFILARYLQVDNHAIVTEGVRVFTITVRLDVCFYVAGISVFYKWKKRDLLQICHFSLFIIIVLFILFLSFENLKLGVTAFYVIFSYSRVHWFSLPALKLNWNTHLCRCGCCSFVIIRFHIY